MGQISLKLDFTSKKCLIIGYGKVGKRKANKLNRAGAIVDVYDLNKTDDFRQIENLDDIKDYFLVVIATNDEEFNTKIEVLLKDSNVLVNNATTHSNNEVSFLDNFKIDDIEVALSCPDHKRRTKFKEKIKDIIND